MMPAILMIQLLELMGESTMVRGIIIIHPSEEKKPFERSIDIKDGEHIDPLKEFLKENNLFIKELENATSYMVAVYLAQLGYAVLHIDNFTLIYLPENISKYQYSFLKKNTYQYFRKYNGEERVGLVSIEDGKTVNYSDAELEGIPPSKKFKELLRDKKTAEVKQAGRWLYV